MAENPAPQRDQRKSSIHINRDRYDESTGTWLPATQRPRADTEPDPLESEEDLRVSIRVFRRSNTWGDSQRNNIDSSSYHSSGTSATCGTAKDESQRPHSLSPRIVQSQLVEEQEEMKTADSPIHQRDEISNHQEQRYRSRNNYEAGVVVETSIGPHNGAPPCIETVPPTETLGNEGPFGILISNILRKIRAMNCRVSYTCPSSEYIWHSLRHSKAGEKAIDSWRSIKESSWILLLLLGICTSIVAWTIDEAVLGIQNLHELFTSLGNGWLIRYLLWVLFRVWMLLLAVSLTHFISPLSAGSGIPEMKSILSGFTLPNYLSGPALVAKCCGLICALGSGISIGKEGPFVHLSCIIASQLLKLPMFRHIRRSSDLTHHVLSAACAAGVTATFGAPIGGVLFSIEVTANYYMTTNYWRAFFCSVMGVVMFRWLNEFSSKDSPVSLFTTEFDILPYRFYEIVLFLILAAVCGILGGLFVRTYTAVIQLSREYQSKFTGFKVFHYATFVALVFGLIEYPVGSFMLISNREAIDDMFQATNLTNTTDTHLDQRFHTSWSSPSLVINLVAFSVVRFVSTAVSAAVAVPCGIVTPIFAIGAAVGRLFGEIISFMGGGSQIPGGYAVVGAASFTAGVTGTVSIAVIVFELTSQLSYMVPVLLSVLVGRAFGSFLSLDIYDAIALDKNLPQWPKINNENSYSKVASDLMRPVPSYRVSRHQTRQSIVKLLEENLEVNIFPVVEHGVSSVYLGAVDRYELEALVDVWERCLNTHSATAKSAKYFFPKVEIEEDLQHTTLQDMQLDNESRVSDVAGWSLSPNSRHGLMTTNQAFAGLTASQIHSLSIPSGNEAACIDLVSLGLFSLDSVNFHVNRDTFASHIILLISVHKSPQLFVTGRGRLIGVVHADDFVDNNGRSVL